uniref:Uncharacterized protein n=1 Tax=Ditylenchus dipsaci TaxID=166011 RepID=A0A915CLZ6_9BILA
MGEIVQMIQNKDLHLVLEDRQTRAEEAVTNSANQLGKLEKEVMEIATEVTSRIEHSLQVNKVLKLASDVTEAIQQRHYRLLQMNYIPNSLEDANQAHIIHQQFRSDCENVGGMLQNFQEKYACANFIIADPAKRNVTAEVMEQVKNRWFQLVGLTEIRTKLLNTAVSYYKCVSHVVPVSESMEHDLRLELGDFCVLEHYDSLEKRLEAIVKRLNKHTSLKERFLEASLYAQKTSEIFIRYIRRCQASEKHISSSEMEVNAFKDNVREQQTRILELWHQRKARIEQCQHAVMLQIASSSLGQWIEAECENCVSMISIARSMKASSSRVNVEELKLKCMEFKSIVKEKRSEVKLMLEHSKRFLKNRLNDFHNADIEQAIQSVPSRFTHLLNLGRQYELAVNQIVGNGESVSSKDDLSLDRYSDSTIEDKIEKDGVGENVWNKKMIEPMRELLTSEKDYIDHLRTCIDVYLRSYRMAGSSCPSSLRNKEVEIFGNIEQLYDFHSGTFLKELMSYEKNPEDVGYCFIQWMEQLKELYADYCLNKDENNHIICLPEAIKMFSEIRERNNLPHSHDLQSMVIKPVQRITRYRLMLEQLIKGCSVNTKEIKDAYEVVVNIPKLANDRMHLKNFDSFEKYKVGDFIMQDSFVVYEPKRYFKPNRDLQVFLFESNIVFTKKEEIAPKKIRYAYKDSILLCELHVVEHVEGDNTKFGLRKGSQPHQNDMTSVLKANNENSRMRWVKTLRDLKMDMKKASIIDDRLPNLNRVSQVSKDSNTTGEDRYSIASTSSVGVSSIFYDLK